MPELPEVETIRRGLAPHVEGRDAAAARGPRRALVAAAAPREIADACEGRRVERLGRRGKYLVFELSDEVYLHAAPADDRDAAARRRAAGGAPHTRVRFDLGDHRLSFVDPRRFGTGELQLGYDAHDAFLDARLGLEPFDDGFDGAHLRALARGRRAPVKAFLLDQTKIAGVGNIYADEALFRARIHPLRPVGMLKRAQLDALRGRGGRRHCRPGIDAKGASIDDFRDPYGVQGSFQDQFLVHLREGLPCPDCGTTIVKLRAAGRGTYVCPRCQPRLGGGGLREVLEPAGAVGRGELLEAADVLAVDDDLGEGHQAGLGDERGASVRVLRQIDLLVRDLAGGQKGLGGAAEAARLSGVHDDTAHYFTKDSDLMAGRSLKTEAIVLRSMRYGEADRILHLYTPHRGRVSAIAKGVRKAKSRFGGRLEPFFRLDGALPRGPLGHADRHRRDHRRRPSRACARAARRSTSPPAPATPSAACSPPTTRTPASTTCSPTSSPLLDAGASATAANGLAFRLKLLLAAGIAPQLSACANCGEAEHVAGFSGAAGGVVCPACEAGSFRLDEGAHAFLVAALGSPLADAPAAEPRALAQADRAVRETAEHHAGVRLASLSDRVASGRMSSDWVVDFADGSSDMRDLLGGKGANVAEMTRVLGAERVPAGFTITTEACVAYMRDGSEPEGMEEQVEEALERLQETAGKRLGDPDDPLLVSVRSGARESMPGMLDTVLNLGLNDESVEGLAKATGNERFAWDSYRRFVQMFGNVVRGIDEDEFETEGDPKELVERHKRIVGDFPQDPREQLRQAIRAVFDSWQGERAVAYRRAEGIPDEWGTAVNVQQMVFGNKGETSGSGVAFSRDFATGAPGLSGDFLIDAQGEDVVSGNRSTLDIGEMGEKLPEAHAELVESVKTLERHYRNMQDVEFTVEEGRLFFLQTRDAKRPPAASVRFACDAVTRGC